MIGKRKGSLLVCAATVMVGSIVLMQGCTTPQPTTVNSSGLTVVASFPPIYSLTAAVAGPDAKVVSLLKAIGPHSYKPTPSDALLLQNANLFFTNGLGLDDSFTTRMKSSSNNPKLKLVDLGKAIPEDLVRKMEEGKPAPDPHVWLGIPEAEAMVKCIRDQLMEADPAHATGYHARAQDLLGRLKELQVQGSVQLGTKAEKVGLQGNIRIISFHDSLNYFARTFNITIAETIEIQPGSEPSGPHLKKLVDLCKDEDIRLIAVEPQYPQNTAAQIILKELKKEGVDAKFVVIDPMETAEEADLAKDPAGWYLKVMKANLDNLTNALP